MTKPLIAAVISFLNQVEAKSEAQAVEDAAAFVVCCHDTEIDKRSYMGPFADPVEAMRYAEALTDSLNARLGSEELPWVMTVEVVEKVMRL
jgi:hypothetical protein